MKFLIPLFIAFTTLHAQATSNPAIDESCATVTKMGVLAKDNMPYWAAPEENSEVVEQCYQAIVVEIQKSPFTDLRLAHSSVQVLQTDDEFAAFIEINENGEIYADPNSLPDFNNDFNTDVPQAPSLLPITRPAAPAFFTN